MTTDFAHAGWLGRQRALYRAMVDPFEFAVGVLGYDRLTAEFHKPILDEMMDRFLRRPLVRDAIAEQVESGLLLPCFAEECDRRISERRRYYKNSGICIARDHYKTTMMIAFCVIAILLWPEITISHWHAVEGKAIECSQELGDHFHTREALRRIRPEIMPSRTNKQFSTAKGFTVERRRTIGGVHQKKERHPTFFPKGAGAEVTGGHSTFGWLDDIVGQGTIDDSSMPKIRNWLGHTVSHVIRTDGGWLMSSYTPWDEDDVMTDWEKDSGWDIRTHACMEDEDGKPDYNGTPVLYDMRWIQRKQKDPLCNFPYQMMVDRVPDSERRWPLDWDGHCKRAWALEGNGRVFVLSDPAPMGLSLRGEKDKVRGSTGKDWWAIAVVRLRVRGDFQDNILLDGSASQQWTDAQGYDEACRLMKKWGTNLFLDEDYSGGQLFAPFRKAAMRNGVQAYYEPDKKNRIRLPQYNESYVKSAKKQRFQKLCDQAESGGVWIADSCPEAFWKGDSEHTGALTQAAKWIPRRSGESSLKWDDFFDAWARATDSKLQKFAPQPSDVKVSDDYVSDPFGHFRNPDDNKFTPRFSRYI